MQKKWQNEGFFFTYLLLQSSVFLSVRFVDDALSMLRNLQVCSSFGALLDFGYQSFENAFTGLKSN